MNAPFRTLPVPSTVRPVRERGASALDRVETGWPAPTAAARVLDRWGMPPREESLSLAPAGWPAPDPVMRFDLPAPHLRRTDLVEPRYAVTAPNLELAARDAISAPIVAAPAVPAAPAVTSQPWPAPSLATAAPVAAGQPDRSGISRRAVVGLAAAAGALAAGAAVLVTLF